MLREEVISDSAWINTIFDACVDLLLWGGDLIGMTYYEINVWFFCNIWPVFTLGLMIVSGLLFIISSIYLYKRYRKYNESI